MNVTSPRDFVAAALDAASVRDHRGELIWEGGQSVILRDSLDPRMALKLYKTPRSPTDLSRVQELIRLCGDLDPAGPITRPFLDSLNLPVRPLLNRAGQFGGVQLPLLPADTMAVRFTWSGGRPTATSRRVRFEAQHLIARQSVIGEVSGARQIRFLLRFANVLACMHSAGLVHGDLSTTNVLVRQSDLTGMNDQVYLIDLDEAFATGDHAVHAVRQSAYLKDPYSAEAGYIDKHTDVFLLALWFASCLQRKLVDGGRVRGGQLPDEALVTVRRGAGPTGADILRKS